MWNNTLVYFRSLLLNKSRLKIAFSLVELMMAFVALSVLLAAFTPMITKKLNKTGSMASSMDGVFEGFDICVGKPYDASNLSLGIGDYCNFCSIDKEQSTNETKVYECVNCILEDKECEADEYIDSKSCKCSKCADKYKIGNNPNTMCQSCNESSCEGGCLWQITDPQGKVGDSEVSSYCDPSTHYLDTKNCDCRTLVTGAACQAEPYNLGVQCTACDSKTHECIICTLDENSCSDDTIYSASQCKCITQ